MFMPPDRIQNRILGLLTRALPIYLIPFLLGGNATRSLYCILVTVTTMASDVIPVPVAAFVPIVLVQLMGLMEAEKLGSAFMNLEVLTASTLLVIVIAGDQTPVFSRVALRLLCTVGFQAPLLFACLTAATLLSTFLVPSGFVVILSTIFVERFMSTVEEDLWGTDLQRWSKTSRARYSSDTTDHSGDTSAKTGFRQKARIHA
ncbi:unnamed protein product [Ixodes pacificus]